MLLVLVVSGGYNKIPEDMLVTQCCLALCDPMDCSPPGSFVHGILQARLLEWVSIPFSRGSSQPRDQTRVSYTAHRFFSVWATRKYTRGWVAYWHLFLMVLEAGKSKIKVPADLLFAESLLPGSQTVVFLCPHKSEMARKLSGISLIRALIPFMRALPSWPTDFLKPHLLVSSSLGIRISTFCRNTED